MHSLGSTRDRRVSSTPAQKKYPFKSLVWLGTCIILATDAPPLEQAQNHGERENAGVVGVRDAEAFVLEAPADVADIDFFVLLPAYVLSELKTAFQLGFMIFLPFLVIDLIVASVLMAMGMMMLSPMMISLPFKLMIDGALHITDRIQVLHLATVTISSLSFKPY